MVLVCGHILGGMNDCVSGLEAPGMPAPRGQGLCLVHHGIPGSRTVPGCRGITIHTCSMKTGRLPEMDSKKGNKCKMSSFLSICFTIQ